MKKAKTPKITLSLEDSNSSVSFDEFSYSKTKLKGTLPDYWKKENEAANQTQSRGTDFHVQTLKQILEFRNVNKAPVDTMGCDQLHDPSVDQVTRKFQILVGIMLSVQTTDEVTSAVVRSMVKEGCLTPSLIAEMSEEEVESRIKRVNFHKTKAKNLIKAAKHFEEYGPPQTLAQVLKFSGVGLKVGTLYTKTAIGTNDGIGVDTHVHRITNRLGWVRTNKPEDTEKELQKKMPKEHWGDINHALVGYGQVLCFAKQPKCHECPIAKRCPSSSLK